VSITGFTRYYKTVFCIYNSKCRLSLVHQPTLYNAVVPATYKSAVSKHHRPASSGVQLFEQLDNAQHKMDAVGRPLPHLSAQQHTTGEAVYVDDLPFYRGLIVSLYP